MMPVARAFHWQVTVCQCTQAARQQPPPGRADSDQLEPRPGVPGPNRADRQEVAAALPSRSNSDSGPPIATRRLRRNFYYSESQGRAAGPRSSCQRRPPGPERHGCPGLSQCCVPGPAVRASPVTAQHGGQCARPDGSSESDGLPNLKHNFLTNFKTLHFHGAIRSADTKREAAAGGLACFCCLRMLRLIKIPEASRRFKRTAMRAVMQWY